MPQKKKGQSLSDKGEWRVRLEVDGIMHHNLKLEPGLNRFDFWVPAAVNRDKKAQVIFKRISGEKVYCRRILWDEYERIEESGLVGSSGAQESEGGKIPFGFYLGAPRPNPFNRQTTIEYGLAQPCRVQIRVYDVTGRVINVLTNEYQSAGIYKLSLDAQGLASGVYFIELETGKYLNRKKIIRLKNKE